MTTDDLAAAPDQETLTALGAVVEQLHWLVDMQRKEFSVAAGLGHGAFIGDADVDIALRTLLTVVEQAPPTVEARLRRLSAIFELDPPAVLVIAGVVLASLDRHAGVVLGYLNDDATQRGLSLEVAQRLAGADIWDGRMRHVIGPGGPLVAGGLIHVDPAPDPLASVLRAAPRLVGHLIGVDVPDPAVAAAVQPLLPGVAVDSDVADVLTSGVALAYLRAEAGGAAEAQIAAVAAGADVEIMALRPPPAVRGGELREWLRAALLEAAMQGAVLVLGPVPEDLEPGELDQLSHARVPVWLHGRLEWDVRCAGVTPVTVEVPEVTHTDQGAMWQAAADAFDLPLDLRQLSAHRIDGATIVRTVRRAITSATARGEDVAIDDVLEQVRREHAPAMEGLAIRITPTVTTDALVLPTTTTRAISDIVHRIRNRDRVRDDFKVRSRGAKGRGFTGLFAGPSGTGKTLAAEGISGELGVDLFVVNVASVVSKYIGETEKNLEQIFTAATDVDGLLFFDEADALFGKRSGVSDARDRYANLEVAYLLQRLERFDGAVVLASNLRANLDAAFTRRLDTIVAFPEPGPVERRQLWQMHLPPELPRDEDDLDLDFAAERFTFAGGAIAAACQSAAHEVARTGRPLNSGVLARAIVEQSAKMGRLVREEDLGPWARHVRTID